jgi:hypothetical protein
MRHLLLLLAASSSLLAATTTRELTLAAGEQDRANAIIRTVLALPAEFATAAAATVKLADGRTVPGQVGAPNLLAKLPALAAGQVARELVFVLPELKQGQTVTVTATLDTAAPAQDGFRWIEEPNQFSELRFGARPVVRYMRAPLDDAKRTETYKVFHHVFDPATGERLITKGPGGEFTHHRGVFFGFNKVTYGDNKSVDIWHANRAHQADGGTVLAEAGPVFGRHRVKVQWHGINKELFGVEERELTAYNVPGGILLDWATRLTTTGGVIKLDGDPQHAGFHYRADNEVAAKTKAQTYYLRPDGQDKPGATRNWPGQKTHANLPWDAMSYVLGDQRYTVAYLDRPENPKEARFSERDYGRFGSYFVYEVAPDKPLELAYRLWIQRGELTGPQVAALSADFVTPVAAK